MKQPMNSASHLLATLVADSLVLPNSAIPYRVNQTLHQQYPELAILETSDAYSCDLMAYAQAGYCELELSAQIMPEIDYSWSSSESKAIAQPVNAWYQVQWEGHTLQALQMGWSDGSCGQRYIWLLADQAAIARAFFEAVCHWNSEVRAEVLVFEEGYWHKDTDLFDSIQMACFETLILADPLKPTIRADAHRFFAAKVRYTELGVPWKRGVLLIGPPGNGKTHCIKALIKELGLPCLYVRSFNARYENEHTSIRKVFERARDVAPCVLVFEDLDSLINNDNRSFFLNELDGFKQNEGLFVIATTNHPDRLDPAICDRPSRFDRKYHFELPALDQRSQYLQLWNQQLKPALQLSAVGMEAIAQASDGFSYAYLKELILSATMIWVAEAETLSPPSMDQVMLQQTERLQGEMRSAIAAPPTP